MYRKSQSEIVLATENKPQVGSFWCRWFGHKVNAASESYSSRITDLNNFFQNYQLLVFDTPDWTQLFLLTTHCCRCTEKVFICSRGVGYCGRVQVYNGKNDGLRIQNWFTTVAETKKSVKLVNSYKESFVSNDYYTLISSYEDYRKLLFEGKFKTKTSWFSNWESIHFKNGQKMLFNTKTFEAKLLT